MDRSVEGRTPRRMIARLAGLGAAALLLAACSSYSDSGYNPLNWNYNPIDWFGGDEELATLQAPDDAASDGSGEQPSLASVPDAPATSTAGQRAATAAGLQADRQNALYDEPEEEEEVVAALAPAPTQPVASAALSAAGTASDTGLSAAGAANQTQLAASGRPLSGQQTAITGSGQAATTARSLVSQPPAQSAQTAAATSTATQTAAFGQSGQAAQAIAGQAVGAIEVNTGQGSVLQQTMQQALAMSASATTGIVTTGTTGAGGSGLPVSAIPGQSLGPSVGQGRGQTGLGFAGGTQLATLYFSHDSAGLSGQDLQVIGQLVNLLERSPGLVRVVGHASSRTRQLPLDGHLLANFQMSVARADAVAAELVRRGIDPARIIRQAMGDSAPVYSEAMPSGEAGNRRVEIWLDG